MRAVAVQVEAAAGELGRVRTSTTFPSLSSAVLESPVPVVARLEAKARLWTVDYHGCPRKTGGDPVSAVLLPDPEAAAPSGGTGGTGGTAGSGDTPAPAPCTVKDCDDGTYSIQFRPGDAGR